MSNVKRIKFNPVLYAALGAVIGLYVPGALFLRGGEGHAGIKWILVILFFPAAALCLFRVLASLYPQFRTLQLTSVYSAAFTAGLCLGIGAAGAQGRRLNFGIPDKSVTAINGALLEDPRIISGGRAMASLSLRECAGNAGLRVSASGELTVFFPEDTAQRLRDFGRGTVVFAEGTLRESSGGQGNGWIFSAESMHIVKPAPALERFRTGIRMDLIRRFDAASVGSTSGNTSSWGGLALALWLGVRDSLDSGLTTLYRNAGCSYVLALSGMHLAVLASLIALLLKKPLGLKAAAVTGAFIIILYCFIVGPMPSLNRAALMYLLGVLAVLGAFPKEPMTLLCLSFMIQIIISPRSGYSISFILSYLALAGILIIGEALFSLFAGKAPSGLLQPLCASLGAFLATAGITAFFFGILRPVGIVTGLVLVPLTTVFMIGSLAWLVLNFAFPPLSGFLTLTLTFLYRLMEKTVSLASGAPGINASRPLVIIILSLVLSLFILWFESRRYASANRLLPFSS